jgi:hypothetical protein
MTADIISFHLIKPVLKHRANRFIGTFIQEVFAVQIYRRNSVSPTFLSFNVMLQLLIQTLIITAQRPAAVFNLCGSL